MRRRALVPACVALAAALALGAGEAPVATSVEDLLFAAATPAELRVRMVAHAAAVEADRPEDAARALLYAGRSFERSGLRDSAIAAVRRSMALHGEPGVSVALADLLLRRRAEGDVRDAIALLEGARAAHTDRAALIHTQGLLAWAQSLAGDSKAAFQTMRGVSPSLQHSPEWRYRVAKILADGGQFAAALEVARPLAVEGRLQDAEVAGLLRAIGEGSGAGARVAESMEKEVVDGDRAEIQALGAFGARRARFFAADGFGLGGIVVAPDGAARRPAVVVLGNPGEPSVRYDSLLIALRDAGFATIVLDVRGAGWSVAPACPLMDTWEGRQDRLGTQVARDVRVALRHLAGQTAIDTTRYAVMGIRSSAPLAVEAAALDAAVAALVLVSPSCEPVERGPMRARVATRALPLFIQRSPEDHPLTSLVEALYEASNRGESRVVESRGAAGALLFRQDPSVLPRLTAWLAEHLPRAGRAPRPSTRR